MRLGLWIFLSIIVISLLAAGVFSLSGKEVDSPSNWIAPEQIKVYKDRIVLDIQDSFWAQFSDTNSMDPFLDEDAHAIEIIPESPLDINVGDVIAYRTSTGTKVHRVIALDSDADGMYYVVKGDNNLFRDSERVRFSAVNGVIVAVIY
jgi:hypothetical protein